jgi:hypothetical protein
VPAEATIPYAVKDLWFVAYTRRTGRRIPELLSKVLMILGKAQTKTNGKGVEAGRNRITIEPVGVGGVADPGQAKQGDILPVVLVDNRVERAAVAVMTQLYARRVERNGCDFLGDSVHLVPGNEQELGLRIDESPDQPRTGHTIHACVRTGYPFHAVDSLGLRPEGAPLEEVSDK